MPKDLVPSVARSSCIRSRRAIRDMIHANLSGGMVVFRTIILVLMTFAIVAACDRSTWPPNRAQLARIFDQKKATFVQFEQEMAADGLLRMSPGVFSEMARNPTIPSLPSDQASKYLSLFDRAQMFVSIVRLKEATQFELMIENVGPRLYLSRFIHTTADDSLPNCAPSMQQMACGTCSIHLERDWHLEYSWFPASPDAEAREC